MKDTIYITTGVETFPDMMNQVNTLSQKYGFIVIPRHKKTIKKLMSQYDRLLVVYKTEYVFYQRDTKELTFHPNTAMIRIKQNKEPLLDLIGSPSKIILDTTMGMASDSLVMSYAGHMVTAIESELMIYEIVTYGLKHYDTGHEMIDAAMKRIQTIHSDALMYMKTLPDNSVDIVYVDPMFSQTIEESTNLDPLKPLANTNRVTAEFIMEARRISRSKIIIKAHYLDSVFEKFGFKRKIRKHAKFHFGVIECCQSEGE